MVKKYFPHIFITSFLTFLVFLGAFNKSTHVGAIDAKDATKKSKYYEGLFKKLTLKTTKGNLVKLSKLNQRVVIINFWASWCRPCVSEFKSLNKLKAKLGAEQVFILGVNNDSEDYMKLIKKTEKKYKLSFESVVESKYELASKFSVTTVPASFIYINGKLSKVIDSEFDFMDKEFINDLKQL